MNLLEYDKRAKAEFMMNTIAKSSHLADPIDVIFQIHKLHEQMCTSLEEIADGLPNRIDSRHCAEAVAMIGTQIPVHQYNEENCLFPLLLKHTACEPELEDIIKHSLQEHDADECVAAELIEILDNLAAGEDPKNPDMLGYMLRGFFEGYRRHVAWENVVLLPLARRCLSAIDLEILSDCMAQHQIGPQNLAIGQ